jgi:hypothetical protein
MTERASHQLINQTGGDVEYCTPVEIVEAARRVMGTIDLDPASSENANRIIKAAHIYTEKENGLLQPWHGNVWLNHPFGRAEEACTPDCNKTIKNKNHVHHAYDYYGNAAWVNHLDHEYEAGRLIQSCNITFASTSEAWFQPLAKRPQCYLCPRTNYRLPDGTIKKGVPKGSVVTYYGTNLDAFAREFAAFGVVKDFVGRVESQQRLVA